VDWYEYVRQQAPRYNLDPDLVARVMRQESGANPAAVSPAGAIGLMQLMPGTAKDLGVDPRDPRQNIHGGLTYLQQQMERFNDPALALAAYNAGPGAVQKHGGIPPFDETQKYVRAILGGGQMQPQPMGSYDDPGMAPADGFEERMRWLMEMQQQQQRPTNPLLHIGLGILSTPTGTGSPLMGIARGVRRGLAAAGATNPQAMTPVQMLQAEAALAKLESGREERTLSRKQRAREEAWRRNEVTRLRNLGTPEDLQQADMLEAQVVEPKNYLDFLEEQRKPPEIFEVNGQSVIWDAEKGAAVPVPVSGVTTEQPGPDPKEEVTTANVLVDNYRTDTKPLEEQLRRWDIVKSYSPETMSGVQDRSLIVSYAKMLDPTSAVMTGEAESVAQAGRTMPWITDLWTKAQGQGLSTQQRQEIMQEIEHLARQRSEESVDTWTRYSQQFGRAGIPFEPYIGERPRVAVFPETGAAIEPGAQIAPGIKYIGPRNAR